MITARCDFCGRGVKLDELIPHQAREIHVAPSRKYPSIFIFVSEYKGDTCKTCFNVWLKSLKEVLKVFDQTFFKDENIKTEGGN